MTILTGLFLFVVLFVYKGYNIQQGLSYSGHGLFFRSICFGLLTSFIFYIHEFFLLPIMPLSNIRRKILWVIWEVFMGANFIFLLFNYFWNWTEWYWPSYFLLIREYYLVMFFPISFCWILSRNPKPVPPKSKKLAFISENGKHKLQIKAENLIYLKSEDNYVEIYYISDGQLKCELQRNSLKNIEQKYLGSPFLSRCHRSYMINPANINQIIATNRQIQLDLGYSKIIPVSKKYQSSFTSEEA
ncbi:LytR/AlgR family response regulator transcription factor [Xanthovirga aplysinae]|uniref:LytR/AlgR family response regulator transcription factor n=1 Tax=Xanthovirga aplysinae TaxID=2529853 RepID=UPI001CA451D1|nr:LytTR family DNA-binding domain-containing protein [Xanthovirga aplysinae]